MTHFIRIGLASAALTCLANGVEAQAIVIDFETIPGSFSVDSFSHHYPDFSLASMDQWQGDHVNSDYFENLYATTIGTTGNGPLTIAFASPVRDVAMDFGSGMLSRSVTVNVSGYLAGQFVYSNTFVTQAGAEGGDEVRANNPGLVDSVIVRRDGGDQEPSITMDHLSYVAIPEPSPIALGGLALLSLAALRRRK